MHVDPANRTEVVAVVRELSKQRVPFYPQGNGTTTDRGAPIGDIEQTVSLAQLDTVTRFAPEDLTCGVEPGLTVAKLRDQLEEASLAFEPGPFANEDRRTIGGILAEAPPSPRGFDRGSPRSNLIGIAAIDGNGRELHAGGNVVKNVAGYDLMKLYVGSGGAYFVALELQLRCVPLPETARWLAAPATSRADAAHAWLELRRRLADARALDLCMLPGGRARVEALVAGSERFVDALSEASGLEAIANGRAAMRMLPGADEESHCGARGRLRASEAPLFVAELPPDCVGRIHHHGSFAMSAALTGSPAPTYASGVALRLKQAFGGILCPGRTSFDTAT
ncbi:MAG: FAD-binding oxidoreductase [Planctomycetota bacterium]|nr:FAD-binding oxidoreductase [Planctomycetota bacterium]